MYLVYHMRRAERVKYGTLLHSEGIVTFPCARQYDPDTCWVAAGTVNHTFSLCRHQARTKNSCELPLPKRRRGWEKRARIPLLEPSSLTAIALSHADITGRRVAIMRKLIACAS